MKTHNHGYCKLAVLWLRLLCGRFVTGRWHVVLAVGQSVPEGGEMMQPCGAYPEGVRGVVYRFGIVFPYSEPRRGSTISIM